MYLAWFLSKFFDTEVALVAYLKFTSQKYPEETHENQQKSVTFPNTTVRIRIA